MAAALNVLANILRMRGHHLAEARDLLDRAMGIRSQRLHAEHPELARSLNNKAMLYEQGMIPHSEAEQLLRRAIDIREKHLPPGHPETAASIHNLGVLLMRMDRYEEAEALLQRAYQLRVATQVRSRGQHMSGANLLVFRFQSATSRSQHDAQARRAL